ncbi:MAG: PsbP-related protein [Nitrososphaeraceae archaeon]
MIIVGTHFLAYLFDGEIAFKAQGTIKENTGTKNSVNTNSIVNSTGSFLSYDNNDFGIRIQYPFNWENVEHLYKNLGFVIIEFVSPQENVSDEFPDSLSVIIQDLGNVTSLSGYVEESNKKLSNITENIVQSGSSTLADNPAHTTIYTLNKPLLPDLKEMQTFTVKGDKAYIIIYTAESDKYDSYLPIAQKMIDSFQIMDTPTPIITAEGNLTAIEEAEEARANETRLAEEALAEEAEARANMTRLATTSSNMTTATAGNLTAITSGNMTATPNAGNMTNVQDTTSPPPCPPGPTGEEQIRLALPGGAWSKCFAPSPLS